MPRCVLFLFLMSIINPRPAVCAQESAGETITIRDKTYVVYPPDQLRAKGLNPPEVPRDHNAAYVYIDAINAIKPVREGNDLVEALNAAQSGTWPQGEHGEYLAGWLAENKPALDLARRASLMQQYSMPLFKGDTNSIIGALLPNLADLRQLSKMLVMEGTYLAQQGQPDAAMQNFLAAQRMGSQVSRGSTLIEALVGLAVQNMSNQAISAVAESGAASPDLINATVSQMEQIAATYPKADELLERERYMSAAIVEEMIEAPSAVNFFDPGSFGAAAPHPDPQDGWYKLKVALKRVYLPDRTVKKHVRRFYDDVIDASRGGRFGSTGSIEEDKIMARVPVWSTPARMLLPSLARVYELTLRAQSNSIRARTSAAVAAYRQTHSAPPAALSQLVPGQLPAVPVDPMTGAELEYALNQEGLPTGLEPVTSQNEEQIRARRIKPIIVNTRSSQWQQYVQSFRQRYRLSESQTAAAEAILRSLEARAISYEVAHGEAIQKLRALGDSPELRRELAPLDEMFEELKKRLIDLPSARQREQATVSEPRP